MPREDIHEHWRPWVDRLVAHRLRCQEILGPGPLHAAAVVQSPKASAWLAYGENHWAIPNNQRWTRHAEAKALEVLQRRAPWRRPQRVCLVVVRTTTTGHWGLSKPCAHCLLTIWQALPVGCHVARIVYTVGPGRIATATLSQLLFDEPWHVSQFYRDRQWQLDLAAPRPGPTKCSKER